VNRIPIITGLGLVTPLGNCVQETWNALLAERFITTHARCPFDSQSGDRIHRLAIAAAKEAISDARWNERPGGAALVMGTSKGAIDAWTTAPPMDSFLASTAAAVRATCPLLDGPSLTISAACASGLHALIRAAMMIRGGEAQRVLVVAAEASVSPMFLASFRRLGVLPAEGVGCRPFDVDRDGFLMSEAAAAVCLESADPDHAGHAYARVDRYALAGDATHITSSDPGAAALRRIVRVAVDGRGVDLIHAHGTGTIVNDPIEAAIFESEGVVGGSVPAVYSHKGALGHSLGASGLVSIVLNCLAHRHALVPRNVQTPTPLPGPIIGVMLSSTGRRKIRRSLSISAGFGGAMAAVSLVS
jgi:3-oxoacyl-[acyl-carrier-protein] synthase II